MDSLQELKVYSITISVANLSLMVDWYQQKLGFSKQFEHPIHIYNTKIQFLELNGFRVELIENTNSTPFEKKSPPVHTENQGIVNFCFETESITRMEEELKQKEYPFYGHQKTVN